jgi:hypothetical protein
MMMDGMVFDGQVFEFVSRSADQPAYGWAWEYEENWTAARVSADDTGKRAVQKLGSRNLHGERHMVFLCADNVVRAVLMDAVDVEEDRRKNPWLPALDALKRAERAAGVPRALGSTQKKS